MARLGSLILGVIVALSCVSSSAQAATLGRIFALQFTSTTNDFLGLGALPRNLELLAVMNDGGNFTDLRLFNGSIAASAPQLGTFDLGASFWTIGNGVDDTFTLTGLSSGPAGRILNFTISTVASAVSDTNQNVANADAILRQPATLGSAFSFIAAGNGYQGTVQAVPEPGTMALLIGAVTGMGYYRRRKAKQAS